MGSVVKLLGASYQGSLAFILSCYFIDAIKPRISNLHCLSVSPIY